MRHVLAPALLVTLVAGAPVVAEQPLVQPSSYGVTFEGPALALPCVASLKARGERGLVEDFRARSPAKRRVCLEHVLQSLTPEPDFTADDFRRALAPTTAGQYTLSPPPAIARQMAGRLGVNLYAARGLAALAQNHLIDDSSTLRPLVDCLEHPLLEVGRYCNRALAALTRHTYGERFYAQSLGAAALTVENHRRVVADWRELTTRLAGGRPIFDSSLAAECEAARRAIGAGLVTALGPSPQPESYLRGLAATTITPGSWQETIFAFDVSAHNTASWPRADARLTRVALTMVRPGVPQPASAPNPGPAIASPDYTEAFPALDLEVRFAVGTPDDSVRQAAVRAVRDALDGLRALDGKRSP